MKEFYFDTDEPIDENQPDITPQEWAEKFAVHLAGSYCDSCAGYIHAAVYEIERLLSLLPEERKQEHKEKK